MLDYQEMFHPGPRCCNQMSPVHSPRLALCIAASRSQLGKQSFCQNLHPISVPPPTLLIITFLHSSADLPPPRKRSPISCPSRVWSEVGTEVGSTTSCHPCRICRSSMMSTQRTSWAQGSSGRRKEVMVSHM